MTDAVASKTPDAPRVTVIIPCLNGELYLAEALSSALGQTHGNVEVVFIDDGSTDGSLAIAQSFPGVTVLSQPNAGISVARNAGMDVSDGEFVLFLDADDRLYPDAVREHLAAFSSQPEAPMVFGEMRIIDPSGAVLEEPRWGAGYMRWNDLLVGFTPLPSQCMFRREAVVAAGRFNPDVILVEDMDLYLRVATGPGVYGHGRPVCDYRRHSEQATTRTADTLVCLMQAVERFLLTVDDTAKRAALLRDVRVRWSTHFGEHIPLEVVRCMRKGDWRRARRATGVYLRYLPRTGIGSLKVLKRRVRQLVSA